MKNNLVFNGKVEYISAPETIKSKDGSKTYQKQYICVVETEGEYPSEGLFEVFNKPEVLKDISVGSIVEVSFDMKVVASNGKHFGHCSTWKVKEVSSQTASAPNPQSSQPERAVKEGNEELPIDTSNELPF